MSPFLSLLSGVLGLERVAGTEDRRGSSFILREGVREVWRGLLFCPHYPVHSLFASQLQVLCLNVYNNYLSVKWERAELGTVLLVKE